MFVETLIFICAACAHDTKISPMNEPFYFYPEESEPGICSYCSEYTDVMLYKVEMQRITEEENK